MSVEDAALKGFVVTSIAMDFQAMDYNAEILIAIRNAGISGTGPRTIFLSFMQDLTGRFPTSGLLDSLAIGQSRGVITKFPPANYRLTPKGKAAVDAYRSYEQRVIDPLYDMWRTDIDSALEGEDTAKLAMAHVLGPEKDYLIGLLDGLYPNSNLSNWEKVKRKLTESHTYGLSSIKHLLKAQSEVNTAAFMIAAHPDLHTKYPFSEIPLVQGARDRVLNPQDGDDRLFRIWGAFMKTVGDGKAELTPLGMASTEGMYEYYLRLQPYFDSESLFRKKGNQPEEPTSQANATSKNWGLIRPKDQRG